VDDILDDMPRGREHSVMAAIRGAVDGYREGGTQRPAGMDLINERLNLRDETTSPVAMIPPGAICFNGRAPTLTLGPTSATA
jgi:hypothetical protein